jgi:hypothetical protein
MYVVLVVSGFPSEVSANGEFVSRLVSAVVGPSKRATVPHEDGLRTMNECAKWDTNQAQRY